MFATKPKLRDCGVSVVASVLVPKTVYHFAFGKATVAAVEETERGYGDIIRQSLGVAKGFPWNVLSGSLEYDGLGALQLATEVTKARLRQFQSMITSSAAADCSVSLGKGGAGESGFCYEAGASVEVAPEEALGSGGWGEKKKTPKAQHAGWCSAAVFEAADVGRSA